MQEAQEAQESFIQRNIPNIFYKASFIYMMAFVTSGILIGSIVTALTIYFLN